MKLTIIETGQVPQDLRHRFQSYPDMFRTMFERAGGAFRYQTVSVWNDPLPAIAELEGIAITGSPAGVYEDHEWLAPLREFIRAAYAANIPMLGICFGHQIMADALGGDVRKSDKGWGIGRHSYDVVDRPDFMADAPPVLSVVCSHQDQVITAPDEASVILSTPFTPNAGLYYRSGKALSFQPHPEFEDDYARALTEMRRDGLGHEPTERALASFEQASDSALLGEYIVRFFEQERRRPD